ncbi:MAG: 30S ribosome-binding factor RbfA [Candidatus Babeliales bacterium]|nr:30S ribosome-binding factor RbfA [Candidatus Babeliales bacterium]
MSESRLSNIKKSQKESLLLREISTIFSRAAIDDKNLQDAYISRVKLSDDKGVCYIFFYCPEGEDFFNEKLKMLKLYKPSLRKAIAKTIKGRYVPELIFKYDNEFEKQRKIEDLLDKIKDEDSNIKSNE